VRALALDDGQLARLADLVVERLLDRLGVLLSPPAGTLVDASTLARELGCSRQFVYEHQRELGVVQIGAGAKPRLRFDVQKARAAYESNGSACTTNVERHAGW
jgi:hypothetical protein